MRKKYTLKSNTPSWFSRLRANGLQRTLLLFVVLPLVLLSALGIRFGLDQAGKFQEKRLKNDLKLIGRAISLPVGTAINNNDMQAVKVALDSVFVLGEVYGASVFDVDGNRIASAGVAERDLSDTTIPARIRSTGKGQEAFSRVHGRNLFSHFLPLFDASGRIQGLIQITRKASDFGKTLQQLMVIAWLTWGVFSLTILAAVMLGHYGGVGRHVDTLLRHMSRASKGGLAHRLSLNGPTEVVHIAQGLNRMLDSIEQANSDLHAHRVAETQLVETIKENEKMVVIGSMAQGVAHELGAPLSVIDGRARRLERQGQLTGDALRQVKAIRDQVSRLTRTVHQLLDYSRPAVIEPKKLSPAALVKSLVTAIEPELEAKDLVLTTVIDTKLPGLSGDAGRLELALLNLLRNALQEANKEVRLAVSVTAKELLICITDDGPGLDEQCTWEKLVQPFFSTKPPGEGTGLGLAIAHSVAQEHRGQLQLNNCLQGGCEAKLLLPLRTDKEGDSHASY